MQRLLLISCVVACAAGVLLDAAGLKIKTEYDRSADFSSLRSYAWLPTPTYRTQTTPEVEDRFLAAEALDGPIRNAVDRVLATKGLKPAAQGTTPDCFLVYYAAFGAEINANVLGEHYAYITGWGSPQVGGTPTTALRVLEQGTVVIDLLNRDKKVAIWRATANGAVDRDQTDQQRLRRIKDAAESMFKKFPPGR
jgi:uncharacterized protein DUF4136